MISELRLLSVSAVRIDTDEMVVISLFEPENTTAKLLVDSASLPLVKGSTIDYATELIGSSFRVVNNPQSKDAGCGCGVSKFGCSSILFSFLQQKTKLKFCWQIVTGWELKDL